MQIINVNDLENLKFLDIETLKLYRDTLVLYLDTLKNEPNNKIKLLDIETLLKDVRELNNDYVILFGKMNSHATN